MKKQKWAIYKGEVGLYAWEYVDTLKRAREYIGGHLIKKEDLPLIFNAVGGRCGFNKDDPRFVEIRVLPEDDEPLTAEERYPKNTENINLGWIDPQGNNYSVGYGSHRDAATAFVEEDYIKIILEETEMVYCGPEDKLYSSGWISVCTVMNEPFIYSKEYKITEAQYETLKRLGHENDQYVKMYYKNSMEE